MIELYNEDCFETLCRMKDGEVDFLLQDTPFGCTQNEWDIKPDLLNMWPQWERVTKESGAMIFFATQPFASELVMSNIKNFRYDLIWEKDRATGWLNAEKMPMRCHEYMLVFYRKLPTYNPQKTYGKKPANASLKDCGTTENYGKYNKVKSVGGNFDRFPRSIVYQNVINSAHEPIHPTQKPLNLIRYLIKTYSNENDLVFDGYCGSGTTAVASLKEGRRFKGAESNSEYFIKAKQRIETEESQPTLFKKRA